MSLSNPRRWLCLLTLICASLLSACGENITVPDSDNTPPTISLSVLIPDEDEIVLTSESDYVERNVDRRDTITFTAIARDEDGGVMNVRITGEIALDCLGDVYGKLMEFTPLSQNPIDAGPGDTAQTVRMTTYTTSIPDYIDDCPEGYSFNWLDGMIYAYAENFHGGVSATAPFYYYYPEYSDLDSKDSVESTSCPTDKTPFTLTFDHSFNWSPNRETDKMLIEGNVISESCTIFIQGDEVTAGDCMIAYDNAGTVGEGDTVCEHSGADTATVEISGSCQDGQVTLEILETPSGELTGTLVCPGLTEPYPTFYPPSLTTATFDIEADGDSFSEDVLVDPMQSFEYHKTWTLIPGEAED